MAACCSVPELPDDQASVPSVDVLAASLAYQFAAVVSGFTPFVVTLLYAKYGWAGAAALFGFYGLLGLVAALVTAETFGPAQRSAAERRYEPSKQHA